VLPSEYSENAAASIASLCLYCCCLKAVVRQKCSSLQPDGTMTACLLDTGGLEHTLNVEDALNSLGVQHDQSTHTTASWHGFQHVTRGVRRAAALQRPRSTFTCRGLAGEAALHTHCAAQQLPPQHAVGRRAACPHHKASAATSLHSRDSPCWLQWEQRSAFQRAIATPRLYMPRCERRYVEPQAEQAQRAWVQRTLHLTCYTRQQLQQGYLCIARSFAVLGLEHTRYPPAALSSLLGAAPYCPASAFSPALSYPSF